MSTDNSWSNLVGKPIDEAVNTIQKDKPDFTVIKLEYGSPVTADHRNNRVRVYFDEKGNVAAEPKVG